MSQFADNIWFEVIHCGNCGIAFAMTSDFYERRRRDHKTFYCPNGHGRIFSGPTEEQKIKKELERKEQMLNAAQARAATAEQERKQITTAHKKMRERVMNGVCPCCNRTFQNLMQHMRSEHPDFSAPSTLYALRTAFGMTQAAVAKEAHVDSTHVSLYERGKPVAEYVKQRLDDWLERHNAAEQAVKTE